MSIERELINHLTEKFIEDAQAQNTINRLLKDLINNLEARISILEKLNNA